MNFSVGHGNLRLPLAPILVGAAVGVLVLAAIPCLAQQPEDSFGGRGAGNDATLSPPRRGLHALDDLPRGTVVVAPGSFPSSLARPDGVADGLFGQTGGGNQTRVPGIDQSPVATDGTNQGPARSGDATRPPPPEPLQLGVLAPRGSDATLNRWSQTAIYLERRLGRPVEVSALTLDGLRSALEADRLDMVLTNPGHFVDLEGPYRLAPLATLATDRPERPSTGNRFGSVIFTRNETGAPRVLSDLKGRTLAAVSPSAFGGYLIAYHTLLRNGIDADRDLETVVHMGFPQSAIVEAVLSGEVDAGTVRTGIIEEMIAEGRLEASQIRLLNGLRIPGFDPLVSTMLFPEWTVGAAPRLAPETRKQVTVALLEMPLHHRAAVAGNYGGWHTPMSDSLVREVLQERHRQAAAPSTASGWTGAGLAMIAALVSLGALAILLGWRRWTSHSERSKGAVGPLAGTPAGTHASTPDNAGATVIALDAPQSQPASPDKAQPEPAPHLTRREAQVLAMVRQGLTTKQIARRLGISPKTVEFHRGHLIRKFDVRNSVELAAKAADM